MPVFHTGNMEWCCRVPDPDVPAQARKAKTKTRPARKAHAAAYSAAAFTAAMNQALEAAAFVSERCFPHDYLVRGYVWRRGDKPNSPRYIILRWRMPNTGWVRKVARRDPRFHVLTPQYRTKDEFQECWDEHQA